MPERRRWIAVWVCAVLPLLGWWAYGLLDLDEGFYGAVTAEMNRRGEWITPYYNGQPWFEKPILLYWLAKPCLALFGMAIGPRLPSVLSMFGTYGVVGWFVRRRYGDRVAQLSVLVLSGSLLTVAIGRMMLTDPMLLLCLTAALLTFWESLEGDRRWRLASGALVGVGILAKGPVAALIFLLVAAWVFWREPDLRPKFRGEWGKGFALMLLVVATWYVPAYLADGRLFVDKFLVEQNIGRFTGGDAAHTLGLVSLPFYIPILLVGMLPWSLVLWPRTTDRVGAATPFERFLWAWAGVVFVFFSLSGAKLPHYILPAVPPLAILVACNIADRKWSLKLGLAMGVGLCAVANAAFLFWYRASGEQEAHDLIRDLRRLGGDVALFQLGRQSADRGTGRPRLQETSLPSLVMYLNRTVLDTGRISDLIQHRGPLWVFTRDGRIGPSELAELASAGRRLSPIETPARQDHFRVYFLQ